MKRAVLCVENPQDYIDQLNDYSIMIVNPNSPPARLQYLLDKADYSLLITKDGLSNRPGRDYPGERLLWYTSGTTGDSKFCSFTQAQLSHLAETIVREYNITANDRYVSVMPLSHAHGQGFYWATKLAGCEQKFLSIKDIRQLPTYSPTFITAVPDVLKVVNQLDFKDLRFIRSASAPLSDALYRSLQEHYRLPVIEAFGMTEALSHCFTNPLYGVQRMGTVGLPSGIEADIVDGQLYIRGPSVFVNDWYNTGDLAERDEDGYYRILGRHKDQINIKGKKLNPVSLENQLRRDLKELGECVVFGSNRVKCLYTGLIDADTIKQTLLSYGTHCRPHLVKQVNDIPISPSGKVSRTWLDAHF